MIKVCSIKRPFSKKLVNWFAKQSIYSFLYVTSFYCLLKAISEQTIVQVFFKDKLIFKKQSNIDSLKISCHLTLPFRLISSKWKAIYWVKCYVIFLYILIVYYYSNVKSNSSHCRQFQLTIFLNQTTVVANVFH